MVCSDSPGAGPGFQGDMASQGQEGPFGECLAQAEMFHGPAQ